MSLNGTTYKRCNCKGEDGKALYRSCPDLAKRRHGTWQLDVRVPVTGTGAKNAHRLRRAGYATQTAAQSGLKEIDRLLDLAGGDPRMRQRIGDLIVQRSRHGGQLPAEDEVRRKLGAGTDLTAPDATVGEWLEEWYAGKRGAKLSTRTLYRGHIDHYLKPLLGDIPRDKLRVEHIVSMFDSIEEWNAEVQLAREQGREPYLPDDPRKVHRTVGIASQHRILATLRTAYNVALKRPGMINWNPCLAVELPPETRDPARVWSPDQIATFLAYSLEDRLGLLYRIILLHGPRRGEALGMLHADLSSDRRRVKVWQTILHVAGKVVIDTPKTRAGERTLSLDSGTAELIPGHLRMLKSERLAAGEAYQDHGLLFCREDGSPYSPDYVSKHFRRLAAGAGLPQLRLHEARHTAATLALEAGIDRKIVSTRLGHSTVRITEDLYTHVRQAVHDEAAETVLNLLPTKDKARGETAG